MQRLPANHHKALRALLSVLAIGVGALALTACGGDDASPADEPPAATTTTAAPPADTTRSESTPESTTEAAPTTRTVTVFFADANAQTLVEESRPSAATGSVLRAALVELANGPATGGPGQPALPAGTAILGTDIQSGVAIINLSDEFSQGYPSGGAAAEFAVLAPLVYTATAVDGVERVRITVQGQTPAPAGSQFDWAGTFSRADFPDVVAVP